MTEAYENDRRRQKREWYHRNRERLKLQQALKLTAEEAELLLRTLAESEAKK